MQISNEANQCLNVLLAKYDPFRCLAVRTNIFSYCSFLSVQCTIVGLQWSLVHMQVIVPLLVSDDEKILVVCINCLTKVPRKCNFLILRSVFPTNLLH